MESIESEYTNIINIQPEKQTNVHSNFDEIYALEDYNDGCLESYYKMQILNFLPEK